MNDIEKLRWLRYAVLRALREDSKQGRVSVDCPECNGLLDVHIIGCPVWAALYGELDHERPPFSH